MHYNTPQMKVLWCTMAYLISLAINVRRTDRSAQAVDANLVGVAVKVAVTRIHGVSICGNETLGKIFGWTSFVNCVFVKISNISKVLYLRYTMLHTIMKGKKNFQFNNTLFMQCQIWISQQAIGQVSKMLTHQKKKLDPLPLPYLDPLDSKLIVSAEAT